VSEGREEKPSSAFSKPDLWIGLILGTVVGRTVDLISDQWWIYLLVALLVYLPSVVLKDWLTKRVYARRNAILAADPDMRARRVWWVRTSWNVLDFVIGVMVLAPASLFLMWFGARLQIFGRG
jgi:hypothetical protein